MADTITILTKKAFRFRRPDTDPLTLVGGPTSLKFDDIYVTTEANEPTEVPSWVQKDPMFKMATDAKELLVVHSPTQVAQPEPQHQHTHQHQSEPETTQRKK